tara:strand:+ start:936 stop:1991 length:1056 start_codon:yes stop_codon:yes gene_type:complete
MNKNFVEVRNVDFEAGGKVKVKNVSFAIENKGEIICLLGPSGIGKTTILRSIAGLQKISKGYIKLKSKIISSDKVFIEPEDRNISLSFQENALFPHYSVGKNIEFGEDRKKKNKGIKSNKIIKLLNISKLLDKYPHQISAGEAQRVSLARSLVSNPDLLLLDEPLSNIDENFKEEIQVKLKKILKDNEITTIIVTHDSEEAFYLGDKCGLILDGRLKQFDEPYNIYHSPNSVNVVSFLNKGVLIPAKVTGQYTLECEDLGLINGNFVNNHSIGANVKLLIQPEDLEHDDKSNLQLEVVDKKFRGSNFIYTLKTKNKNIVSVFVHSHHVHQHQIREKFGIKKPIHIKHLVCF